MDIELSMEQLSELLRTELEEAVEVKNSQALRRFTILLSENIVSKREYDRDYGGLRGDIRVLTETMDRRFDDLIHQMDKRFDEVNTRFEDVNARFEDVNARFEDQSRRFEDQNRRFEDMNGRFNESNHKFNLFMTLISISLGIIMAILAYGTFFAG